MEQILNNIVREVEAIRGYITDPVEGGNEIIADECSHIIKLTGLLIAKVKPEIAEAIEEVVEDAEELVEDGEIADEEQEQEMFDETVDNTEE